MRFVTCVLGLLLLAGAAPAQQYPIRIRTGPGVESNSAATAAKSGYLVLPDGGRLVPSSAPATEAATADGELWLTDGAPASNAYSDGTTESLMIFHAVTAKWRPANQSAHAITYADAIQTIPGSVSLKLQFRNGTNGAFLNETNGNVVYRPRDAASTVIFRDGNVVDRITVKSTSKHVQIAGDMTSSGWWGFGITQQSETLGPDAATLDATKSYVVIAADAGTNTLTTATCTGCIEGDEVEFHKSGANGLNFSASGTGANQFARACDMSAADSTSRWRRAEGGYWRLLSCVP